MKRFHSITGCVALVATALLTACGSGGSIDIGGGQDVAPGSDFPIFYVKRTIPLQQDDLRQQRDTAGDADLFMRNRASPSSTEVNITGRVTGGDLYDIKDVDVSQDGRRVIFAMRGPLRENQDEREAPTWGIWEYHIPADALRRVISSDTTASEGHDISPQYLPDGRIVFSSTRQRQSQAILRDEGKPGFEAQAIGGNESAFLLHVMNADGTDLHQITFGMSHDLWPSVMQDGRVLFTRWDGATGRGMHLYTVNPDGTDLQLHYGARSHNTGTPDDDDRPTTIQFTRPREMQNGRVLSLARPWTNIDFGGDLVLIDTRNFVENEQPLAGALVPGEAQSRATPNWVSMVEGPSYGGRFRSAFPLWDGTNRLLVSWSVCRLLDYSRTPATIVPCTPDRLDDPAFDTRYDTAPPLYSAFVFNPADNTFRPLFQPEEGVMITDLVAAQPRSPQDVRNDQSGDFDASLVGEGLALLEIRSVYDIDGTYDANGNLRRSAFTINGGGIAAVRSIAAMADPMQRQPRQRAARFLRIEKAVSLGDRQLGFPAVANQAFGASGFMREIIGYAPIEPDGSVSVRVPANIAFVLSVLDANGRRLFPEHRAWLQLRPGEVRRCAGCHEPLGNRDPSHGRGSYNAQWEPKDAAVPLLEQSWGATGTAPAFPNTLAATSAAAMPGDTMAQARARTSCISGSTCSQKLSVNVLFDDVWTDPALRAAAPSFAWTYGSPGLATPAPVRPGCITNWNSTCRIVINYAQHIQPIWDLDRGANTCTNCHAPTSAIGAVQVPAGQLDLSGTPSAEEQLHLTSYRDLFFADGVQDLVGGAITERTRANPTTGDPEPVIASRSLLPGNARGSRFFNCFASTLACNTGDPAGAGGTVNHHELLSESELRLISEWVDIGAQYFNNPFDPDVPLN